MKPESIPFCPYCKKKSKVVRGKTLYPHHPALAELLFFSCFDCDAHVGTHKHTGMPLGRLANKDLRRLKSKAHRAFDPIWREAKAMTRKQAYRWLAGAMNIDPQWCHIGMFNEKQCKQVIDLSYAKRKEYSPIHKMLRKGK